MQFRNAFPLFSIVLLWTLAELSGAAENTTRNGEAIFVEQCASCHEASDNTRAPSLTQLRGLSPAAVVNSLASGKMSVQGAPLAEQERRNVAEYMTGLSLAANPGAVENDNFCTSISPLSENLSRPGWNSWGANAGNTRFQSSADAGLTAADIPALELAWAFGFPDALAARTQPVVIGDWLFTGGENGMVYALDSQSACTVWRFQADAAVRTAMTVKQVEDDTAQANILVFFGDGQANAYALNAESGTLVWQKKIDEHPNAGITGSPTIYEDTVYFPVSAAGEEVRGPNADYACCTFRGSVSALDMANGDLRWKTHAIEQEPQPRGISERGIQLYGPAGAGIWGAPTVDEARGLLYVGTGNGFADPAQPTTDAIVAMELDTGSMRWVQQTLANDNWLWQCEAQSNLNNPNCPAEQGPDFDFSVSPLIATREDGQQVLVVPQKSGMVHALDPDNNGTILWQTRIGTGSSLGGQWGAASDGENVYVGVADTLSEQQGGLYALALDTGEPVWYTPPRPVLCNKAQEALCYSAQGGPVTAIPGVVFSGSSDGGMRAYATNNGNLLWEFDTNRDFATVNGVAARGATIDAAGPIVVNGMVYVNSGYNGIVGRAGNVLLAFRKR